MSRTVILAFCVCINYRAKVPNFFAAKRHMLQITNILGLVLFMPNVIFSFYYVAYLTPFKANFAYLDNLFSLFMHYESRVWNSFKDAKSSCSASTLSKTRKEKSQQFILGLDNKYLEAKSSLGNWPLVKGQKCKQSLIQLIQKNTSLLAWQFDAFKTCT